MRQADLDRLGELRAVDLGLRHELSFDERPLWVAHEVLAFLDRP